MPLVTTAGFASVEAVEFKPLAELSEVNAPAIDLPNDADPTSLTARFSGIDLIRIPFPSSHDGRGFSLAQRLRDLGYTGRLRACGALISDQFRYALECGFDEVEIDDAAAARQPEAHWTVAAPDRYRDKLTARRASFPIPSGVFAQTVTEVAHYTDQLFKFRMTRPPSFRFRSGEFAMIGLPNAEKPVFRAYSIASPAWDEELEFFSIKAPGGLLTEHLQKIQPGDTVLMRKKATGTLVSAALTPGARLYMVSTGTGVAPFASLIRDPETYEKFDQIILIHTCRERAELAYGYDVANSATSDPLVGDAAAAQLVRYATTTREESPRMGRVTDLIASGKLFDDLGVPRLNPETDRVMICGSMDMLKDVKALCQAHGLNEGANNRPGEFVVERAFVD